ncbi:Hint domain-containing protein [Streptomyces mirabilis]|uniref:Hint domain-containing protein n=1 Tax=Streptomyces mirabilis TaxID=68239 RepID=UPI0022589AEB|nr:Hint domain-containing protein [Streptomyces mirabilis]MCX4609432.1 Hint domain-containing protein [Streptomyces mirabilis]
MQNQTPLDPAPEGFPAGTMILTLRGLVPIETVAAGDEVFTHERRWQPVLETMSATADTVRVHGASFTTGLVTTADHPFHTRTAPVLLDGGPAGDLSAAGWTRARDLTDSHRLASPLHFGEPLPIPDLPAGLADADPVEVFRTAGAMIRLKGAAAAALRPELVDWLTEHFGQYGAGRRFPAWALTMPETLRIAFLVGLVNDAPHREQNQVRMHSKAFMVGLRLLVCSLGFAGGMSDGGKPGWQLHWKNEGGRRPDFDGYRWHRAVRAVRVERGPKAEVFALCVAEDGSYLADGITA